MNFQELFLVRLETLLDRYRKEKCAVFFKGFSKAQNRAILSREDALACEGLLLPDGSLSIPALEAGGGKMADRFPAGGRTFCTGVYEQLIRLFRAAPDLQDRCGGRIAVVENNLFPGGFPSAVPAEDARRLYDFFQSDSQDVPEGLGPYLNYYAQAVSLDESRCLLFPLDRCKDEKTEVVPFFPAEAEPQPGGGEYESVAVSSQEFLLRRFDLAQGRLPSPACYVTDPARADSAGFGPYAWILSRLGLPFGTAPREGLRPPQQDASAGKLLPLLKRHWGSGAEFRELRFYRDPEHSSETVPLSQGELIARIVRECDAALAGKKDFHNIFITAPTGAGKSLLFQLPALYLAESRPGLPLGAVTVVITPLIALMKDQVAQLEQERGVTCATFINSTITFEEREARIRAIREGKKSIVYLAPELLISTPLEAITGGRPVGLFVVDEAHIVTSWGKDFRADYWYLGDFLARLKRRGRWFPVLCLTATAVYGGPEDIVHETVESLSLENPTIFLGGVRRSNIRFEIRHPDPAGAAGSVERFKIDQAVRAIRSFVERGEKTLVYCPFVSQVDDIYNSLEADVRAKVKKYYGTLDKNAREDAQNSFRSGGCTVMVCTKAFGMGVDVRDIRNVYHFAPTGSLADYVQEIGRAARLETERGVACADFLPGDIRYIRTLYGISEMKQYQLREILRKTDGVAQESGKRSLLVSPEAFSYLFSGRDLENKVKNGLLLISKDLSASYGAPVLSVRPQEISPRGYVNVPKAAEEEFVRAYGAYAAPQPDRTKRILPSKNRRYESDTTVINSGSIYGLDLGGIWQNHFQDISFMQFRHLFFSGELFRFPCGEKLAPRLRLRATYRFPFPEALEKFKAMLLALSDIFRGYKNAKASFSAAEFKKAVREKMGEDFTRFDFSGVILDEFVTDMSQNFSFRSGSDRLKFVAARKAPSGDLSYRVLNSGYIAMPERFLQLASQCVPDDGGVFQAFIPFGRGDRRPERMRLFALLELLGLATYAVEGGKSTEIFLRINDPEKFHELAGGTYNNALLTDINRRHKSAQKIMLYFMQNDFTNEQRWDIIENYFLGREILSEQR